ncbi:hypothetical protein [Mangrovimonas cancribranchiae]|uniref:Uncharacterized protein n=1 Tax=Mangrovimonas cancribranchiae TaxID=3080055 RepID=A0AAU6PAV0_9FLAO
MTTDLHIISNCRSFTKNTIKENKDEFLANLKALKLDHITIIGSGKLTGDWEYEFPEIYCEKQDKVIPDIDAKELICYNSPFVFNIRVYENCVELITIYKYRFLYEDEKTDYLNEFRKNVYDIISIFGGTEIIYLADNGCDKLAEYLECQVWEGISYHDIKKDMINKKLSFVSDYDNLKLNHLTYRNIKEIVFDDFSNLKVK